MTDIILDEGYSLRVRHKIDDLIDTDIYFNDKKIGVLDYRKNEILFMRNIRIDKEFQRKGHSTKIVNLFLNHFEQDVTLCIATISESAVSFWSKYFSKKTNVENIRKNIYKIIYIE